MCSLKYVQKTSIHISIILYRCAPCWRNLPIVWWHLEVRAIFLDISKAFDKVCHDGLSWNRVVCPLKLLQNYLNNRKSADISTVESGVPQGPVLGPILILVYVNDPGKNIKSNINYFTDDTVHFSIVKHPVITANDLSHDIHEWAYQWKLEVNPEPSKQATELLFSCKKFQAKPPISLFQWNSGNQW